MKITEKLFLMCTEFIGLFFFVLLPLVTPLFLFEIFGPNNIFMISLILLAVYLNYGIKLMSRA